MCPGTGPSSPSGPLPPLQNWMQDATSTGGAQPGLVFVSVPGIRSLSHAFWRVDKHLISTASRAATAPQPQMGLWRENRHFHHQLFRCQYLPIVSPFNARTTREPRWISPSLHVRGYLTVVFRPVCSCVPASSSHCPGTTLTAY